MPAGTFGDLFPRWLRRTEARRRTGVAREPILTESITGAPSLARRRVGTKKPPLGKSAKYFAEKSLRVGHMTLKVSTSVYSERLWVHPMRMA